MGELSSSVTFQLFYLPIGESNGLNGADEGDDEVEDHLEESSRDFVNARLQLDQGIMRQGTSLICLKIVPLISYGFPNDYSQLFMRYLFLSI